MEEIGQKEGFCPYCDSTNVIYGARFPIDGDGYYHVVTCDNCSKNFRTYYDAVFKGNWGYGSAEKELKKGKIQGLIKEMKKLTDGERHEIMSNFCNHCGCIQPEEGPFCQCWNDE